jgi:glutamine synthetase
MRRQKAHKAFICGSSRVIFNGNNYTEDWVKEAAERGLPNIENTVLSIKELLTDKSRKLFTEMKVPRRRKLSRDINTARKLYKNDKYRSDDLH